MVYNLGLRLFKDKEEALDFSQEVFLKVYSKWDSFQGKSKVSTWIYSIGLNYGLNKIKKYKRKQLLFQESEELLDKINTKLVDDNPLEILKQKDIDEIIHKEINELPEAYRLPLVLYYFEKLSYTEIAKKLGVKEGTLKSNIHRGKLVLRSTLTKQGIEL